MTFALSNRFLEDGQLVFTHMSVITGNKISRQYFYNILILSKVATSIVNVSLKV